MTAVDHLVNKYGIDRSRIIVKYNGEGTNLVDNANKEPEHFMNRRVEFYIAEDGALEQGKPAGDGGRNRKWKY
jgi:outer membrane protein OmpA-like peptidoglycan-associated protein